MLLLLVSFVLLAASAVACSDDGSSSPSVSSNACGDGTGVSDGGETYCVYGESLIIEGFRCVEPFRFRTDFRSFVVCSKTPNLPSTLPDVLRGKGYDPEPLPPGLPGDACDRPGASVPADDGCNTCTCDDGAWSCTELACTQEPVQAGGACSEEGATAPAEDGCNTCVCESGSWGCTEIACVSSGPVNPGDACDTEGATAPAEDGCNTCTCDNGAWSCTEIACSEPLAVDAGAACSEEGATANAGDGCNTCVCSEGFWGCTEIGCNSSCEEVLTEGFCQSTSGCAWESCDPADPICTPYEGRCLDEGPRPHQCQDFNDDRSSCEAGGCAWVACGEGQICDTLAPFCSPPVTCGQTCDLEGFQAGDRCGPICLDGAWSCTEEWCPSDENCAAIEDKTSCVEQQCSWVECTNDGPDCTPDFDRCTGPVEPGDACNPAGSPSANAADGCNTCFCDAGSWSCTELDCE